MTRLRRRLPVVAVALVVVAAAAIAYAAGLGVTSAKVTTQSGALTAVQTVSATSLVATTDGTADAQNILTAPITTTNGATLLILAYRESSNSSDFITGITGPLTGATPIPPTTLIATGVVISNKHNLSAWRATGSGATGAVTVAFSAAKNVVTVINVVQLAGNDTANPIAQATVANATSNTATGTLITPNSLNGEVMLIGVDANAVPGAVATFTNLGAANGSSPSPYAFKTVFKSSAQASASSTLPSPQNWGTFTIEIKHA